MKLNNKGFAITTVVYGLSIMGILLISIIMSLLSTSREHNRELSKQISNELVRYSKSNASFDASVTDGQEYVVPEGEAGWYRIELWGAQGGGDNGGYGAYTSGIIELRENDVLYFYVGKHKESGKSGEETDVRISNGRYDEYSSYISRIMVAAGGGTAEGADGGTIFGNSAATKSYGGTYTDDFYLDEPHGNGYLNFLTEYTGEPNASLLGYRSNWFTSFNRQAEYKNVGIEPSYYITGALYYRDGVISPRAEMGGGDGFFNAKDYGITHYGYTTKYGSEKTGGSSYISGYGGNYSYDYNPNEQKIKLVNQPTYVYRKYNLDEASGQWSPSFSGIRAYYFNDGIMLPGVNKGDGKAKITKILARNEETKELPRHNSKLNDVKYIVACMDVSQYQSYSPILSIMVDGMDITKPHGRTIKDPEKFENAPSTDVTISPAFESGTNKKCFKYILRNQISEVDEFAIWYEFDEYNYVRTFAYNNVDPSERLYVDLKNVSITVGKEDDRLCGGDNNLRECSTVVRGDAPYTPNIAEGKTFTGTRFSSYQFDSVNPLPDKGNYYIMSVLYENKALTAPSNSSMVQNPVTMEYINGEKNQQWSIERVYDSGYSGNIYKIVDLSRFNALSVKNDENKLGNTLIANRTFNNTTIDETQLWRITPMNNGTYTIETVNPSYNGDSDKQTGYIVPQTNKNKDNYDKVIIGKKSNEPIVQRWKFYAIDYSSSER